MTRRSAMSLIRTATLPAVALFVIAWFAGFALFGPNGLTSLAGYRQERQAHLRDLAALHAERDRLAHHAALLTPGHVDPDYADEIVRRDTGQVRPDEVILPHE